jgi:hypothetical protein
VARAARAHAAHRLLGAVDDRAQVDLELAGDARGRLLLERRDRHDPRVVDEDVDRPEPALDLVQERGEAGEVGHVEVEADHALAELRRRALGGRRVDVPDRDAGALADERLGERPPDPPATARDDGDLAAQRARLLGHAVSSSSEATQRQC